jgi:hypothetical protein
MRMQVKAHLEGRKGMRLGVLMRGRVLVMKEEPSSCA